MLRGPGKDFQGYLLTSISREFDGITSNDRLSKSVEFIVDAVDKDVQTNSKPILCKKLENLKDDCIFPSRKIVAGELVPRVETLEKMDAVQFRKLAFIVFKEFKTRREILLAKLHKCNEAQLNEFRDREGTKVVELRKELSILFPIKAQKDMGDYEHIINAACHSAIMKTNTWFITNDSFRRGSRADKNLTFEKMAEKTMQTVSRLFGIQMRIRKLEAINSEFKLIPKTS